MKKAIRKLSLEQQMMEMNINNINYNRGLLTHIDLADLHFGAINPKVQYDILIEQVINKIKDINFDLFTIAGDLFDHKYMATSDPVMYATMFIEKVVLLCKEKNATFLILKGTEYHDSNQLKLFYHYLADNQIDIRIVEQVQFEYIKGAKILCIPELYNKGEDYYKYFLFNSGYYDGVIMHGVIKGAIYQAKGQESGMNSEKAPTFTIDDFCMCRGPIISGHVHISGCFNKHFYYCGTPYRWCFGEEGEKGFFITIQNLDTQQYYIHFEPIKSFRYDTINVDDILFKDPKDVINYVNSLKENGIDNIRLEYKKELSETELLNLDIIKQYYKNNSNIKIKTQNSKQKEILKASEEILDKYKGLEFVMDKSLSEYEILTMYINHQKEYNYITTDELIELLKEEI